MTATGSVRVEVVGPAAVVTLDRPTARNALDGAMVAALGEAMATADADDRVTAIVLTGADPAFCAGLDLRALGTPGGMRLSQFPSTPWERTAKPVIAAVNGPAVTGGFELVLRCDVVVASERAVFADTHARVGILPGWGLTVLLPRAVGDRRAVEMSLTGTFVGATDALAMGLVNQVVPHEELLPTVLRLVEDMASADGDALRALLAVYRDHADAATSSRFAAELAASRDYRRRAAPEEVARRREGIIERGRRQVAD